MHLYVDFIIDGLHGNAAARWGEPTWRRATDVRVKAKSVFQFRGPHSVAKATHAGLPWLLYFRRALGGRIHFWPFDGWDVPPGRSAIAEVYPALWNCRYAREGRNDHQQDAYSITFWLQFTDRSGELAGFLHPPLDEAERELALVEGWMLGVK